MSLASRLQPTLGAVVLAMLGTAAITVAIMMTLDKNPESTACVLTKSDMAPFRFPRTRFPQPVVFEPQSEDGAS